MSIALDTSLASTTANSYADVAYCDDYWTNNYNATKAAQWLALTTTQKERLLIQACRIIETGRFTTFVPVSEYALHYDRITGQILDITLTREPVRFYYYQKLQFPRNLDIDPVLQNLYVPPAVLMAQCEQCVYLMNFDESAIANRLQGVTADTLAIGRAQIHLQQEYTQDGTSFAPMALEFIKPYLIRGTRMRRA